MAPNYSSTALTLFTPFIAVTYIMQHTGLLFLHNVWTLNSAAAGGRLYRWNFNQIQQETLWGCSVLCETITLSGSVLLDKATKNMNLIFSLSAFHSVYLQLLSFFFHPCQTFYYIHSFLGYEHWSDFLALIRNIPTSWHYALTRCSEGQRGGHKTFK